jgi:hypothetical protein
MNSGLCLRSIPFHKRFRNKPQSLRCDLRIPYFWLPRFSLIYSLGTDRTEKNTSNGSPIVACMSVAALKWWLLGHYLATAVFLEPFPSNVCLCWLHNSGFQQTCHKLYLIFQIKNFPKFPLLHLLLNRSLDIPSIHLYSLSTSVWDPPLWSILVPLHFMKCILHAWKYTRVCNHIMKLEEMTLPCGIIPDIFRKACVIEGALIHKTEWKPLPKELQRM